MSSEEDNKSDLRTNIELENYMDRITNDDIRNLILTLKLPQNVLDLFEGNCKDEIMKSHSFDKDYADPYMVLSLEKYQQDIYLVDRYKPVLAYASATIFAYDSKSEGYISYDIESGIEDSDKCLTWDGLFVREILRWWEYEISDEHIIYISNFFGLKHTEEILESINRTNDEDGFATFKEVEVWVNEMIEKIGGFC